MPSRDGAVSVSQPPWASEMASLREKHSRSVGGRESRGARGHGKQRRVRAQGGGGNAFCDEALTAEEHEVKLQPLNMQL
jgi:hypothetical protein